MTFCIQLKYSQFKMTILRWPGPMKWKNLIFLLLHSRISFTSHLSYFVGTDKPECEQYWTIDDSTRRYDFRSGKTKSDNYLPEGWYRFIIAKQLSTSCTYPSGYCDASNQGSLQGSHPSVEDGVVSRKVCFGYYQSGFSYGQRRQNTCCKQSTYIKVRNCGSFYVYKLKPTSYNSRYCTTQY